MKARLHPLAVATLLSLAPTAPLWGQLQWNVYSTSGALVTANVATGGDATYGGNVTFTVPANTERIFITRSFAPVDLSAASASAKVNFTLSVDGGLYPLAGRVIGMGLLNDPGTPGSALDDTGYWTDLHTGNNPPSFELFYRPSTVANFFQYDSSHKLGSGKISTGYPSNNIPYGMQFQLNENAGANAISIGTSSSTFAAAGAAITNGNGAVVIQSYSSANPLTTLATTSFNEFAFMFNNLSSSSVAVTLSGLTLVPVSPVIVTNAADFNGSPGSSATFAVAVSSNSAAPLTYQWFEIAGGTTNALADGATANGTAVSGSTSNVLTLDNAQAADSGFVFVTVSNSYGTAASAPALFNVAADTAPALFYLSLTNANLVAGQGTNVTVRATGVPAPDYYWYDNHDALIQSGPEATLVLSNLQFTDAGTYSVVASNSLGSDATNFVISLFVAPCISEQPTNVLVHVGDPVTFSVTEGGCAVPAPAYQWYKNGNLLGDATNATYSIAAAALGDIGTYSVTLSNPAGSVSSSGARLAIYSPTLSATPSLPANNATEVCVDTYLQLNCNQPPVVGDTGVINIYDAADSSVPVDTIDLSQNNNKGAQAHSLFPGDTQPFNYYPVMVTGNTVTIYPHGGVLTTNKTYYVTMDPGALVDADGAYFAGIASSSAWQFTTKAAGPADPAHLVVAADGTGDFRTVQGAVDAVPANNTDPVVITVRDGSYFEIVDVAGKNNVTLRGQSRQGTVINYPNNANLAPGGTTHARMTFKVKANDVVIENLTILNTTPQGGSQAEALMIESGAQRCIVNACDITSRQDTILANVNSSQAFFHNSKISGNFDYIWGGGNLFFENCVLHTLSGSSSFNLTAARTDTSTSESASTPWVNLNGTTYSANGFSFVRCTLEADPGVSGITLAGNNGTAGGLVAWSQCRIDSGAYVTPTLALSTNYVFWQFQNTDAAGLNPVTFANVQTIGATNDDPRLLAATNVTVWFYGWTPQLAPSIVSQPTNLTVTAGETARFSIAATAVPDAAYQWLQAGTNAPYASASTATLIIPSAQPGDATNYAVVVSNATGVVTSDVVSLTVITPAPPTLDGGTFHLLSDGSTQFSFSGTLDAHYRVWATTNLALTPVTSTWDLVGSGTFGAGPVEFNDPQATNYPLRFYLISSP